jgi:tetratricopeptide (TPR) repeat protein
MFELNLSEFSLNKPENVLTSSQKLLSTTLSQIDEISCDQSYNDISTDPEVGDKSKWVINGTRSSSQLLKSFLDLPSSNPLNNHTRLKQLSNSYQSILDSQKNIDIYQNFISKSDQFLNKGKTYEEKGDLDNAEEWYKQALKINPKWAKANFKLAGLASSKGCLELFANQKSHHFTNYIEQAIEFYNQALINDQIPSRERSTVSDFDTNSNSNIMIKNKYKEASIISNKWMTPS